MKKKLVMKMLAVALSVSMMASLAACGGKGADADNSGDAAQTEDNADAADMVLKGGTVITMLSEDDTKNTAVAVKDGEIVYVGDDAGVESYIADSTEVIDLAGKTILPGFIDGHIHEPGNYLTAGTQLMLPEGELDVKVYAKLIQEFIDANPEFPIYEIGGMDLQAFPNNIATNDWLDELNTDKPVVVMDKSHHGNLVNTIGLEMAGITKDTPAPEGGKLFVDDAGELTGYLSDASLLLEGLPAIEIGEDIMVDAMKSFEAQANGYGITAIDSGGTTYRTEDPNQYEVLSDMAESGDLTLRVNATSWSGPDNGGLELGEAEAERLIKLLDESQKYASDFLRICQVKFSLDGVPEGATSALLEPYTAEAGQEEGYAGTQKATQEGLTEFVTAMNKAGYSVQTHAMGDASVQRSVNAFEASIDANGGKLPDGVINKIAHVNLLTKEDVKRMGEYGIVAAMQPLWFYYDPFFSAQEEKNLGTERFEQEYHIREMIDAGIIITGSNDYPVTEDFAPLPAIEAGATQQSPYPGEEDDPAFIRNADQAATVYEMLQMYTSNAAYGAHMDDIVGTIETGKKADFVVLGDNPLTCDVKKISDITVEYTISDGRVVYTAK